MFSGTCYLTQSRLPHFTNAAYRHHYGKEHRYCYEVSHHYKVPCDQAGESCPLKATLETKQPQHVLHLHHTSHGESYVNIQTLPIYNDKNEIVYLLETMRCTKIASVQAQHQGLVGRCQTFNRMLALVYRVAPSETSVLLLGESGTGKELVAQAIHAASNRAQGHFIPVDCSVGDIPLNLQVKLLRLLETGIYRRVGSVEPQQADFRVICATHRHLKKMVSMGEFRIESQLQRINPKRRLSVHPQALQMLQRYEFPGNIRELRNILERASLLAEGDLILPEHLPEECMDKTEQEPKPVLPVVMPLRKVERQYLQWVVQHFEGDNKTLAKKLGVSERTLYRKMRTLKLLRL
ncbi:MAG: sigma 54-interacting transcriptional regulator [Pseudomonadota bacterium]